MADMKIIPSKLQGEVIIPPSKSMAHRAVISAALSNGECEITNLDYSDDIKATINGMRALGARIEEGERKIKVKGIFSNEKNEKLCEEALIDCKESGSTLRFLVPISLLFSGKKKFIGEGNLGKRPLTTYYNIFNDQKIEYDYKEGELDLRVNGTISASEFSLRGDISSQFITGLLFTLPLLKEDSKIIITSNLESKGYIDLTLDCMKTFGIEIINNDYKEFIIKGNQVYKAIDYRVEGDYSQAAFFLSANALKNQVFVNGLNLESLQGDKEVIEILERMGSKFTFKDNKLINRNENGLNKTVIDGSQCPDIIPVLAAVAALSDGTTEIINSGRLRIKECDRLKAVTTELNKLGAKIEEKEDGLIIEGQKELQGGATVWSWKDHRIAMTLAIAATNCKEPIVITDFECVAKSYPHFFEDYRSLGGVANECCMGK